MKWAWKPCLSPRCQKQINPTMFVGHGGHGAGAEPQPTLALPQVAPPPPAGPGLGFINTVPGCLRGRRQSLCFSSGDLGVPLCITHLSVPLHGQALRHPPVAGLRNSRRPRLTAPRGGDAETSKLGLGLGPGNPRALSSRFGNLRPPRPCPAVPSPARTLTHSRAHSGARTLVHTLTRSRTLRGREVGPRTRAGTFQRECHTPPGQVLGSELSHRGDGRQASIPGWSLSAFTAFFHLSQKVSVWDFRSFSLRETPPCPRPLSGTRAVPPAGPTALWRSLPTQPLRKQSMRDRPPPPAP